MLGVIGIPGANTHAGSDHMLVFPTGDKEFLSHLCVLCECVHVSSMQEAAIKLITY